MNYRDLELLAWPVVLLVGDKIKRVSESEKKLFWRDHTILSALIVLPTTVLESLSLGLPIWIYLALVLVPSSIYVRFTVNWRRYLNRK